MADPSFATASELIAHIRSGSVRTYGEGGAVFYSGMSQVVRDGVPVHNGQLAKEFIDAQAARGNKFYRMETTELGMFVQSQLLRMDLTSAQEQQVWGAASELYAKSPGVVGKDAVHPKAYAERTANI